MTHLEKLIFQYYDWQGYLVKRNIKVGPLNHGGWECELDIIAYNPKDKHLIHLEPSVDADSWATREKRFHKKFQAGRNYIYKTVFPWLDAQTPLEQVAVLVSHPKNHARLAGGTIISIDEFMSTVKARIAKEGIMAQCAVPEQYDLLRTIQMSISGYYSVK